MGPKMRRSLRGVLSAAPPRRLTTALAVASTLSLLSERQLPHAFSFGANSFGRGDYLGANRRQ